MSKQAKSANPVIPAGKFVKRDLTKVNPLKEQFAPTPQSAVRSNYKMGGGC